MSTDTTFSYLAQLSGAPSSGSAETIGFVTSDTYRITSSDNPITTASVLTLTFTNNTTTPIYDGYTSPDGGILIHTNHYYLLTNTTPVHSSTFTPISTPAYTSCFATGTKILTARGERRIESLKVGDLVPTLVGQRMAVVRWIGHTPINCRQHPRPWDVNPVSIAPGAFGDGLPLRDLVLSPDHSVFVDGKLFPVRYLVNDATIRQEAKDEITYWHVELERHDVLFADGLPVESYLDTGNRSAFSNGNVASLHPDLRVADREIWDREACADLVESGPLLDQMRSRLAERAATLGRPVAPECRIVLTTTGRSEHIIPPGTRRLSLESPCLVPPGESRRLGVCIASLALDGRSVPLDSKALAYGFHEIERGHDTSWRWTNGSAALELQPSNIDQTLEVNIRIVCLPRQEQRAA